MIKEISTDLNSFELYLLFKDDSYSFFLDSGMDHEKLGRFSFAGADPFLLFESKGKQIRLKEAGTEARNYQGDPFEELRELFRLYHRTEREFLPFISGGVGYFAYDLCHSIENLPRQAVDDLQIPDCCIGFYDGIVAIDHLTGKTYAAASGIREDASAIIQRLERKILSRSDVRACPQAGKTQQRRPQIVANFPKADYLKAIEKIRAFIAAGDIYQANMTQRFECELEEMPLELYAKLRRINPAPFAAYFDLGQAQILSSSPERFLRRQGKHLETRPIKGTRPRGNTEEDDRHQRQELLQSEKDRAELLMIVDLERNDLGKVAKVGSVDVPELFAIESYPTVHHLVATVTGEIREDAETIDCVRAMFPGGSISGAPKIRAMEILDELEPTQRNVYTGSLGYIDFNGDADLNILIRTILCKEGKAYFQAGGGIVWDSDPLAEYEETLHKAEALMRALMDEGGAGNNAGLA